MALFGSKKKNSTIVGNVKTKSSGTWLKKRYFLSTSIPLTVKIFLLQKLPNQVLKYKYLQICSFRNLSWSRKIF